MGKCVVAMAPYEAGWSNVELIKDCGLIPYLLYKNHDCEVHMVGAAGEEYSYDKLIDGVSLDFLVDGKIETKMGFVAQNAKVIDFLVLRGMYVSNYYVAKAYKENNPNGKVYIGLDANAYWMDGLDISDARASGLLDLCDLIATSGKETSRYLNYKWPWKVVHIANGYYDFSGKRPAPDYSKKKNVILTVGRLGTSQKRTDIILEAFANISDRIPDWRLRLVGNVAPEFQEYLEGFKKEHGELMSKIEFTGPILDRELLFQEYLDAKIFAFPSEIEGGTPNVIGEALYGGCAMVTSRFDAGDEACDYGRCGRCVDIGEVQPFGNAILEMIEGDELEKLSTNAYEYGKNEFSMEKIVAQIYERIFGED